ncbi:hypothetical protein G9F72_010000 [Clostridium estertheticum]|uniref:hypothetical protein n=1 Tax=Clostridium estertheticum TaxID=238834 RepID=UPI0013E98C69|nr:hypothetical protein [Clostridium estertheticum]MBZ9686658.1 hypothetical protein [Clostridium estertheticum]
MKSYKLVRYNIKSSLKPIIIYYCIIIAVITSAIILTKISGGNGYSSGLEFSSMIFLFVIGLNFFKENFYFAQANNISREDYFKSVAIAILEVTLGMSIFDVIINRVYNLFQMCPTLYDMSYNNFTGAPLNIEVWIQSNSIGTLFGTVTFLFTFYMAAFAIGLLITLIYYKCNKTMKIFVSLSPLAIVAIYGKLAVDYPEFGEKVLIFIDNILGISTKNSYMAVSTFIGLFILSMFFVYILVRKAVVKRV